MPEAGERALSSCTGAASQRVLRACCGVPAALPQRGRCCCCACSLACTAAAKSVVCAKSRLKAWWVVAPTSNGSLLLHHLASGMEWEREERVKRSQGGSCTLYVGRACCGGDQL